MALSYFNTSIKVFNWQCYQTISLSLTPWNNKLVRFETNKHLKSNLTLQVRNGGYTYDEAQSASYENVRLGVRKYLEGTNSKAISSIESMT
jgi:hypothetical protein